MRVQGRIQGWKLGGVGQKLIQFSKLSATDKQTKKINGQIFGEVDFRGRTPLTPPPPPKSASSVGLHCIDHPMSMFISRTRALYICIL